MTSLTSAFLPRESGWTGVQSDADHGAVELLRDALAVIGEPNS